MSISSMKKLTVFAHAADADRMAHRLMRCRCVDTVTDSLADDTLRRNLCEEERTAKEARIERIRDVLAILHKHNGKAPLVKVKPSVDMRAFCTGGERTQAWYDVERTLEIGEQLTRIRAERMVAETIITQLTPWMNYDLPISAEGTQKTRLMLGTFPLNADPEYVCDSLGQVGIHCEFVGEDTRARYAVLILHRSGEDGVNGYLAKHGFLQFSPAAEGGIPAEEIRTAQTKLRWLDDEEEALKKQLNEIAAGGVQRIEILYDVEKTALNAIMTREKMLKTESCVMLTGWIPEAQERKVAGILDRFTCAWEIVDPEEGDDVPILLQNNAFAQNFEWVLGMYSYPKYGTFDPTFVMSIFYFVIFGIMFADVGYGLLLMIACFGGVLLLKPAPGMKRFLLMFGYCGIASVLWGIVLGSYFGDLPKMFITKMLGLNPPEKIALWFDPIEDPMSFFVLSLAVGVVHLVGGMAVQFYLLCREGKWADALMDIGSWWVLFAGLGLLVAKPSVGAWVAIAGVALIVLTQGRAKKGVIGKLFGGVAKLYDLVNYMADLLSYSRILALGLAAAVIAQVVNILGTLKGGTVVGYILFIVVFLIGHLLNLVINVLGTFVHASRLQYIEFFNKFYVDGGRPYKPTVPSEDYSVEADVRTASATGEKR